MDNLTHSLAGALIGQAGLKKKTGLAMPALIIGANLPDVDVTCFAWTTGLEHLAFRRGITHGPPALLLLPVALAGILWGFDRWQAKRGKRPEARLPVRFGWLFALAFIACLTHPALDWMNTYGIRLLEPFSHRWFYGDVLFIIDVWLWLGMGLGLWLSLRREKRGQDWRKVGRVTIAGVLAYIGVNAGVTYAAETAQYDAPDLPGQIAIGSPPPLAVWRRGMIVGLPNDWWVRDPETDVLEPITNQRCAWPDTDMLRQSNTQLDAFLLWSRAPFAARAVDGSVVLHDARYYGGRVTSSFTLALPDVRCEKLAG
ncbi:metal-dependent hydrolase [Aurantiacibacter suaedae]|uniref:metal-dependent hydrolase n=1 Tax=Aurantiacibacter suaedae TaxID=2545755 RepID=UPI0010F682F0|nr:metal-dependent hydrolase [Aurantiacibacter suaedae]